MNDELLPCPFCGGEAGYNTVSSAAIVECAECFAVIVRPVEESESVVEAWNTRSQIPGARNRYVELFGTPERAAQTLAGICESCKCGDCATCGVPEWADYSHDYGQLLEWLRGDA